jgi:hypothetical protein
MTSAMRRRPPTATKPMPIPAALVISRRADHSYRGECEKCSDRRRWDVAPQYFFDHIFLDRCGQSLPQKFSDAQVSQHCNKRKLADSAQRERDIIRYLFASVPQQYRKLGQRRGVRCRHRDFVGLLLSHARDADRARSGNGSSRAVERVAR